MTYMPEDGGAEEHAAKVGTWQQTNKLCNKSVSIPLQVKMYFAQMTLTTQSRDCACSFSVLKTPFRTPLRDRENLRKIGQCEKVNVPSKR